MMRLKPSLQYLACFLALSCGKASKMPTFNEVAQEAVLPSDGSNIDGIYMAKFETLNPHVNGTIQGSATIQRKGDKFFAYVRIFSSAPNSWHQQNIYLGKRCPNLSDDVNGDGFIDIEEANAVWGDAIIPLDSDISSQFSGKNIFPVADARGTYFYERVTSFNRLFKDLKKQDKDFNDNLAKLTPEAGLGIAGLTVAVLGAADTIEFPASLATQGQYRPHQTLPITCGTFTKITEIPGEEYNEEIPDPVGEVEPDQPQSDDGGIEPDTDSNEDDDWDDRIIDWWRRTWDIRRENRRLILRGDG